MEKIKISLKGLHSRKDASAESIIESANIKIKFCYFFSLKEVNKEELSAIHHNEQSAFRELGGQFNLPKNTTDDWKQNGCRIEPCALRIPTATNQITWYRMLSTLASSLF